MQLMPRHIKRYREIISILVDYGFGAALTQIGVSDRLNIPRIFFRRKSTLGKDTSVPERLRLALEELGPTFIKLGQILSTRPDMLPPEYIKELQKLQDDVPATEWEPIEELIANEWGCPLSEILARVDTKPIASASLAQVYGATLITGEDIVIKVQRPGVAGTVAMDLDILQDMANLVYEHTTIGKRYDIKGFAKEFSTSLRWELDFRREGRNADVFRKNFSKEPHLKVPDIYWDFTQKRVLVMERVYGIKIDDIEALDEAGYDREYLSHLSAKLILQEVLEDGFFHADPHPGNLLILPGEIICVLDFGAVGRLDVRDRINLGKLFINLVRTDVDGIVNQLIVMGIADYKIDFYNLRSDLRRLLLQYYGLPLQEINANELIAELEPIVYEYNLRIPSDFWLLLKTLSMMQGIGLKLDPEFDIFSATKPYLTKLFRQMWAPSVWGPGMLQTASDWGSFLSDFPRQTNQVLEQLGRGELMINADVPVLDGIIEYIDDMINRMIYAILVAALNVALAFLLPKLDFTWPWDIVTWIVVIGFVFMSLLTFQIVWSIFRSRRRQKRKSKFGK